jgi:poly(3-hydroxybutyrate) depolymerase
MRHRRLLPVLLAALAAGLAAAASPGGAAEPPAPFTTPGKVRHVVIQTSGGTVDTAIVLPPGYRKGKRFPVLVALPPGDQTPRLVDAIIDAYWRELSRTRGWIIVSPAAPSTGPLYAGGEAALPPLLAAVKRWYPPEGGSFHLAGVSNGGLSAFRIALDRPALFRSLLVFPGYPPGAGDGQKLRGLRRIPVLLVGGGLDTFWVDRMRLTREALRKLGVKVTLRVSPGEGHIVQHVPHRVFFDFLDRARPAK